ncbi:MULTISPECIES: FAD-dependent oxidoreductase [Streptomyces]|uniref:NAD(P)/FAD-dependent oxidoreductase n=1 Tax=Streptomyces TaxID=1883 RepID=UPI00240E64CB|nr:MULTISPECIES: FAD-dependent oxidoreductase [Streptomyces]WFB88457.1 FAD-dependent oxidoreductase [Streptomyces olivaceus]WGK50900.1 FAD-dependent oxidoreductase [Streptomyces sp. B146]
MTHILVIGGGFAGVWSAAGAIRAARAAGPEGDAIRVTLISAGDDLVLRPRLYEADPGAMRVPLDQVLGPIGVRRLAGAVTAIDTDTRVVRAVTRFGEDLELGYDKLVLAAGSRLVRAPFAGAEHLFDVDTLPAATALDHHLRRLPEREPFAGRSTVVVVGAGFTGLEVATAMGERLRAIVGPHGGNDEIRVVLVDRADVLGPELGAGPRPYIEAAVDALDVELRLGLTVESVSPEQVILSDGEVIPTATVVWTGGTVASPLTAQIPGERDRLGRLAVDDHLRVKDVPHVYAAGDTAAARTEGDRFSMQSCQHAQPMGKFAGHNVVADVLGRDPLPFEPDPYTTCLDLGPGHAVETRGWDRTIELTGEEAKTRKRNINARWIYPSVDDAQAILAHAGRFANGANKQTAEVR